MGGYLSEGYQSPRRTSIPSFARRGDRLLRTFRPKVVYPYHYHQDWVAQVNWGGRAP